MILPVELALLTIDYLNTDAKKDHLSCLQSLQTLNSASISKYRPNYFHTVRAMNNLAQCASYVVTKVVINVHRSWQKMLQHPNSRDVTEIFINAHFESPINQYPPCLHTLRLSDKFNTHLLDIPATIKEIHCLPSHKKYLTTVPKCVKIICGQELYMFSFVLGQKYVPTGNCNFQRTIVEPRLILTEI